MEDPVLLRLNNISVVYADVIQVLKGVSLEVEDGKIEVIGPELSDIQAGSRLPLAIAVEVAGREMQDDYEPILERQIHHLINYAQGIMHIGQRDIAWLRVSKQAVEKGFKLEQGRRFLDSLKMLSMSANLGDTRSIATHPASTTHAKLTEEARREVGISPGLIRISAGLEHIDDIIEDVDHALSQ